MDKICHLIFQVTEHPSEENDHNKDDDRIEVKYKAAVYIHASRRKISPTSYEAGLL